MSNHQELLQALREPMPYKWRAQMATEWGANCVAYIDARDVQQRLDDVFGLNWSSEFIPRQVDGQTRMFCRITVTLPSGEKVFREDTGTESTTEKEKGEVSDAFKRAAVNFGIGRFLYSLGTVKIPKQFIIKNHKGKYVPGEGKYPWSGEKITEYCNAQMSGKKPPATKTQKPKQSSPKDDVIAKLTELGKDFMRQGLPQGKLVTALGGKDWKNQDLKALEAKLNELSEKKVEDLK